MSEREASPDRLTLRLCLAHQAVNFAATLLLGSVVFSFIVQSRKLQGFGGIDQPEDVFMTLLLLTGLFLQGLWYLAVPLLVYGCLQMSLWFSLPSWRWLPCLLAAPLCGLPVAAWCRLVDGGLGGHRDQVALCAASVAPLAAAFTAMVLRHPDDVSEQRGEHA